MGRPVPEYHGTSIEKKSVETTAYSSDWKRRALGRMKGMWICGWEWGLALPAPVNVYIPLNVGRRPSGTYAIPVIPRARRELDDNIVSRARGAAVCAAIGGAVGLLRVAHEAYTKRAHPAAAAVVNAARIGACVGAATGATVAPVGRYWAETGLAGKVYTGHTASGVFPHPPRPSLLSCWRRPVRLVWRTITLQWSARDGTIAADTSHFPFGTRIFVPGWGWGAVQDRGGAIKGPARLDLYLSSREEALKWGRQSMNVIVQRITH